MRSLVLTMIGTLMLSGAALANGLEDARIGFAAAENREFDKAVYYSSLAISSGDLDQETLAIAYNNRGFAHDQLGDIEKALEDYGQAIGHNPTFAVAYNNRGYVLNVIGAYRRARTDFTQAIELQPDYADAFNNRGIANARLSKFEEALQDYNQAIDLKPALYQAYNNRGYARFNLGRFQAAAEDFDVIGQVTPHNPFTLLWQYIAMKRSGADADGMLAERAEQVDLDSWSGKIVQLYLGELDIEDVLGMPMSEDAFRRQEQECELNFYVGQYHLLNGDAEKARVSFLKALASGVTDFTEYSGAVMELGRLSEEKQAQAE